MTAPLPAACHEVARALDGAEVPPWLLLDAADCDRRERAARVALLGGDPGAVAALLGWPAWNALAPWQQRYAIRFGDAARLLGGL